MGVGRGKYEDACRLNTSPPNSCFQKHQIRETGQSCGAPPHPVLEPVNGSWSHSSFASYCPRSALSHDPWALTAGIIIGYALGFTCNVSIDTVINCIGTSTINTHISHLLSGTTFPLCQEAHAVCFGTNPEGFEEVKSSDEIAFLGVSGTPQFLWKHTGCPGQFGSGCYRLSVFQSRSTTATSKQMKLLQ